MEKILKPIALLSMTIFIFACGKDKETVLPNDIIRSSVREFPTKSSINFKFALSEDEVVAKAAQFFMGLEKSGKENLGTRSVYSINLDEKVPQVKTVVRTINYGKDNIEQVPVYVINYSDKKSNVAGGYVVLTGDKRINNILAYSDTGSWGSEEPLLQNFLDIFWENVDALIKNELATNSFQIDTISHAGRAVHPPCVLCEYYSEYSYVDNAKRLFEPALWSQLDPYNGKLAPVCTPPPQGYSLSYAVGCVATAMGNIMAFHKKPASGSYVNYLGQTINPAYNWNTMLSSQYASSLSQQGKEMVQNILAEIGQKVFMQYGCVIRNPTTGLPSGGSGSNMANARAGFAAMTYTTAPFGIDYNYNAVVTEINANRPIFVCGSSVSNQYTFFNSHAWVIDGVNSQTVVEKKYRYCSTVPTGVHNPLLEDTVYSYVNYVYCNLGAENPSNYNGYYHSAIFSFSPSETIILTNIK